jgi:hypothetical protein
MGDPVEEQLDAALIALRHAYEDCLRELVGLREGVGGFTRRRGVLAAAGTTIEHLLKILHRLEHGDPPGKPPRKMTLDELVTGVRGALPEHVQVPIRTIQGYRNLGAHDSGDLRAVDAHVLGAVQTALGLVLAWFFRSYLGGRHGEPAVDEPALAETGPEPLTAWRELFWWAMRGGALKLIDRKGLERRQREAGIPEASVQAIEAGYRRDTALFDAALAEAAGGYVLEDHEAEGLEEVRLEACISEREATTRAARPLGRLVALPPHCPAWMAEAWRSGAELTLDGLPPEPDLAVAAPPPPPSPLDVAPPAPIKLKGPPPVMPRRLRRGPRCASPTVGAGSSQRRRPLTPRPSGGGCRRRRKTSPDRCSRCSGVRSERVSAFTLTGSAPTPGGGTRSGSSWAGSSSWRLRGDAYGSRSTKPPSRSPGPGCGAGPGMTS